MAAPHTRKSTMLSDLPQQPSVQPPSTTPARPAMSEADRSVQEVIHEIRNETAVPNLPPQQMPPPPKHHAPYESHYYPPPPPYYPPPPPPPQEMPVSATKPSNSVLTTSQKDAVLLATIYYLFAQLDFEHFDLLRRMPASVAFLKAVLFGVAVTAIKHFLM